QVFQPAQSKERGRLAAEATRRLPRPNRPATQAATDGAGPSMTWKIQAVPGVVGRVVDALRLGETDDVKERESKRKGDPRRPQRRACRAERGGARLAGMRNACWHCRGRSRVSGSL